MKITATTGGKSASTTPKRPSWADMKKHYPALDAKDDLYKKISKALYHDRNEPAYANTCAFRLSYALNHSGITLPKAPSRDGDLTGDDKKIYWMRVNDFLEELPKTKYLGKADDHITLSTGTLAEIKDKTTLTSLFKQRHRSATAFIKQISKKNGILIFRVSGWGDARGHCTLWDGALKSLLFAPNHDNSATNSYYFWLTEYIPPDPKQKIAEGCVQTYSIDFWELR